MHTLFEFNGEFESKLDLSKTDDPKVALLLVLQVLLLDEVSMIDEIAWMAIGQLLSLIDHSRRPDDMNADALGDLHVVLFGDFKQDAHFIKGFVSGFLHVRPQNEKM